MANITPHFVPQEYQVLYLKFGHNLLTEVQSINVMRTDGGADVETLVRDYAGRVKGAAKAEITVKGVIPYEPTDKVGVGFSNTGMTDAQGNQIDQTMLTNFNSNGNAPIQFVVSIGQPAAQKLFFKGYVHTLTIDVSVGKQADFTFAASGQFATFE